MTARGRWYGRQAATYAVTDRADGQEPANQCLAHLAADAEKSFLGSQMGRCRRRRVRYRTETLKIWSATEPVRAILAPVIGPLQNRLYSFTMQGRHGDRGRDEIAITATEQRAALLGTVEISGVSGPE